VQCGVNENESKFLGGKQKKKRSSPVGGRKTRTFALGAKMASYGPDGERLGPTTHAGNSA
jgi:hypothetical protein